MILCGGNGIFSLYGTGSIRELLKISKPPRSLILRVFGPPPVVSLDSFRQALCRLYAVSTIFDTTNNVHKIGHVNSLRFERSPVK